MVGCLPSMHDSVGSISESHKPVTTMHICNSNTRGMEKGGSRVQEQCWLHSEFEASPGYMRLCLIKIESHGVITTWLQASLLFLHNKRAIIITWGLNSLLQDVADFPFIRVFWKSLWWTFIIFHGFFFFNYNYKLSCCALETSFYALVIGSWKDSWWGTLNFPFITLCCLQLQCRTVLKTVLHIGFPIHKTNDESKTAESKQEFSLF